MAGCSNPAVARSAGDPCQASQECESNLCYEELCIDPAADDDGLTNEVEAQLGTRATLADTDGDGASNLKHVAQLI